jgi:hypothetical protein
MADNETTFGKLVQKDNMSLLIKAATDTRNPNQGYALNILSTVIKEFPDYEKQIGASLAQEFQATIGNSFLDITYGAIMTIRSSSDIESYENQAGLNVRKLGLRKLRALELIRQELSTLSKYVKLNSD